MPSVFATILGDELRVIIGDDVYAVPLDGLRKVDEMKSMAWTKTNAEYIDEWALYVNDRLITDVGRYHEPSDNRYYPTRKAPNCTLGIDSERGFATLAGAQRYVEERLRVFAEAVMK